MNYLLLIAALIGAFAHAPLRADETFNRLENKFTMINAQGGGVVSQPLDGFWWWKDEPSGRAMAPSAPDLYRHTLMGENKWLLAHTGSAPRIDESIRPGQRVLIGDGVPGVLGQFKYDGVCFNGLIRTSEVRVPKKPPECPQYYWWTLTKMCISKDHRTGKLETSGYQHDSETCYPDKDKPQSLKVSLDRFLGAAFAPIIAGRYIHTVTVAAPAQFVGEIKLAWDYRSLREKWGKAVQKVHVYLGQYTSGRRYDVLTAAPSSGVHAFSFNQGGRYHFIFDVHDTAGAIMHSDHLLADLR
jgi:hypothetical protein